MTTTIGDLPPVPARAMGTDVARTEAALKVRGLAPYAVEDPEHHDLVAHLVTSTVARGRITAIDDAAALAAPGVHSVIHHGNAPRLATREDREYDVLQDAVVDFRGQIVAVVLAESVEAARGGAQLVEVSYEEAEFDADFAAVDPADVEPEADGDDAEDIEAALAGAAVVVDEVYRMPFENNAALELHASTARWEGETLTMRVSTQHPHGTQEQLAACFGLEPADVRVIAPHVGGGFGSKGQPHAPEVAAALAARAAPGRTVALSLTRQQVPSLGGYRSATVQRLRLGADADGRLLALEHSSLEQTSRIKEFGEGAVEPSRGLYGSRTRRTVERLAELDVAIPSWMRAPGVFPGVSVLETAMDELAGRLDLDPIELRRRNDIDIDPETGLPFDERRLVECLDLGAQRFGWSRRTAPGERIEGEWQVGLGVATATYPGQTQPGNVARITAEGEGHFKVGIGAADIGTGARTTLGLIAADALSVEPGCITVELGDSSLPAATVAGGSSGTSSWGVSVVAAARGLRADLGRNPSPGAEFTSEPTEVGEATHAHHSYGAIFAEVAVHRFTGEIRARRLLGVFNAGRILNPRGARSQFIGGIVMGLGAALHEESVRDPRFGHAVTQDLASYHVPANADVLDIEALWLPEEDETMNPMGARGIGEIGITGVVPAVVNAIHNATGRRIRSVPVTPADLVG